MSVCRECIQDKVPSERGERRPPCLKLKEWKRTWPSAYAKTTREILCRVGNWCPRFCNLPDRVIDLKVKQQLPHIIDKVNELYGDELSRVTGKILRKENHK